MFSKSGKIGHFAKANAFEILVSLGRQLNLPKTYQKSFYNHITVDLCKKTLKKTANIPKMTSFRKVAKLAIWERLTPLKIWPVWAEN